MYANTTNPKSREDLSFTNPHTDTDADTYNIS